MKMRKGNALLLLWIGTLTFNLSAIVASSEKHSENKALRRQQLGFRPLHFAAVGLPLRDTATNEVGSSKTGEFRIDDGGVVGAGTYEIEPDGVDIDLSMKIEVNGQGKPGGGAGEVPGAGIDTNGQGKPGGSAGEVPGGGASPTPKPALCAVPCSQTKPTTSQGFTVATTPGGGTTGASTAPTVPSGGAGGVTPSQGPGGSATQPTTGRLAVTTPPPSGGGGGSAPEQEGLNKHNEYRKVHGVPPMKLNAEMSRQAAAYAQKIAHQGALQHARAEDRNNDGENLSMGCDTHGQTTAEATTNWYNEVCDPGYTFGQPNGSPGTGHFTQVVWKESVELGIGKADVNKNGMKCTYIVGRYRPAGNMMGDYAKNVPKGSFNRGQACAGVKRATILKYLAPRSIHKKKTTRKTHH